MPFLNAFPATDRSCILCNEHWMLFHRGLLLLLKLKKSLFKADIWIMIKIQRTAIQNCFSKKRKPLRIAAAPEITYFTLQKYGSEKNDCEKENTIFD